MDDVDARYLGKLLPVAFLSPDSGLLFLHCSATARGHSHRDYPQGRTAMTNGPTSLPASIIYTEMGLAAAEKLAVPRLFVRNHGRTEGAGSV
jgi:hypothetical protein